MERSLKWERTNTLYLMTANGPSEEKVINE